ncbi:MAG: efflux RND transporter periplasmic adaptor subunit [Chloroflexota bacterium]|nr:efflux RND transporter periplasmic adaptor subunit [Chloroflexota bacterium]
MIKRLIAGLVVLVVVVGAGAGWLRYSQQKAAEAQVLQASGILEATDIALSSELGRRLQSVSVQEGQFVRRDTELAQFDTDLLQHQIITSEGAVQAHLQRELPRQTLRSPIDGWVVRRVFEPGEDVPAGAPVVVVADWRQLTLKVYLPEDKFGRINVGQAANITVDSYPGLTFAGRVTSVASNAEFTPRDMQTKEDRVKSVYAIKLAVPNPAMKLKAGMFADAVFVPGS